MRFQLLAAIVSEDLSKRGTKGSSSGNFQLKANENGAAGMDVYTLRIREKFVAAKIIIFFSSKFYNGFV